MKEETDLVTFRMPTLGVIDQVIHRQLQQENSKGQRTISYFESFSIDDVHE